MRDETMRRDEWVITRRLEREGGDETRDETKGRGMTTMSVLI